ncbi:hypothetical protein PPUN110474_32330 [Pseudomonas putida]|nr:hypothetical protein PPUN110474_32330 [Pseudomonas putida]
MSIRGRFAPHRRQASSYLDSIGLKPCAIPVGAGLPAIRPEQAAQDSCSLLDRIGLKPCAIPVGAGLPAMGCEAAPKFQGNMQAPAIVHTQVNPC